MIKVIDGSINVSDPATLTGVAPHSLDQSSRMAANPEKLAPLFGLAGDEPLVSLANDFALGTHPVIKGNLSTGLPYAALEMAYVHLGRPALEPLRPAFPAKSGLSDALYQQLLDKLAICIRSEEMRARMSKDIPIVINSVQSILKGLGLSELLPAISAIEAQLLTKMNIAQGECNAIPLAVTLACLSRNPKIYGSRASLLKLDAMAKAFLVKKATLQEKIKDVEVRCEGALKALKDDKAFEAALGSAYSKLNSSLSKPSSAPISTINKVPSSQPRLKEAVNFDDFVMEIEVAAAAPTAEPLPKRKRLSDVKMDILEDYGESWGPRGIVPLLPFQQTAAWLRIEDLERQYLRELQSGK
jgi:hypothetical protein